MTTQPDAPAAARIRPVTDRITFSIASAEAALELGGPGDHHGGLVHRATPVGRVRHRIGRAHRADPVTRRRKHRLVAVRGPGPAPRAAVEADLAQIVPAARPLLERLVGTVAFDDAVGQCRGPATSCSMPKSGDDGRWGIHLDAQTTSATFLSNRFLVYHEIGHAVWGLLLDDVHHQAFAQAVRVALHGKACIDGLGRPCATLPEIFADEFSRFAGGFAHR